MKPVMCQAKLQAKCHNEQHMVLAFKKLRV